MHEEISLTVSQQDRKGGRSEVQAGDNSRAAESDAVGKAKICTAKDCTRIAIIRSMCDMHYRRWRHHGTTETLPPYDRTGDKNPKWRGGEVNIGGRIVVYSPNHPYPNWKRHVYRYRLVMEKHLGRILLPTEHVHHKNEDPMDDRLSNLEVLSKSEHHSYHGQSLKRAGKWSKYYQCCGKCSTTSSPHHGNGLCKPCYDKLRSHH